MAASRHLSIPSHDLTHNSSSGNGTILTELKEFFHAQSIPAFLVGGYVRDSLTDTPSRDLDIAVEGHSRSLARTLADALGGSYVPLGQSHQVARTVLHSRDGTRWVVDLAAIEGSIHDDLARRDFTVNAMALAVDDWGAPGWEARVLDPFGGKLDLREGTIRAIGPSVFRDDPARLLRAVRLAALLGFRIDPHTADLISGCAYLVPQVAPEHVRDEFLAILAEEGAKIHLEILDRLGLLCCIIPELGPTKGVDQPREHYWDVLGHSIHAVEGVERVIPREGGRAGCPLGSWSDGIVERFGHEVSDGHTRRTILKLAALLHDVAKPQTKLVDEKGKTRFLGHHTLGASMSGTILRRLRTSGRGVEMVSTMVENHLRPTQMSQGEEMPTARAVYRYFRDLGEVAVDTLCLSLADHLAARGPELDMEGWRHHVRIVSHVLEVGTVEQAPEKMPRLLTGHDLIDELHMTPGPLVGTLLEGLQEARAGREVETRAEALKWARRRLEELIPTAHSGHYLKGSNPESPGG